MDPNGRTVIITGASSGIGAATAQAFAYAGAHLVVAARDEAALERVADALPGRPLVQPTDVSDRSAVQQLVERAIATFGSVDILINNAGIGLRGPIEHLDPSELERVLAVDLFGPLYGIQAVLPFMRAQGSGQIINVSSVVALRSLPYIGGYAAAKAALDRLSDALRMELLQSGIVVTTVRPGTTRTAFKQRRLGTGSDVRSVASPGVPPELVARTILRAACREPRDAYVTLADRALLLMSGLFPQLADRLLARSISWQKP